MTPNDIPIIGMPCGAIGQSPASFFRNGLVASKQPLVAVDGATRTSQSVGVKAGYCSNQSFQPSEVRSG